MRIEQLAEEHPRRRLPVQHGQAGGADAAQRLRGAHHAATVTEPNGHIGQRAVGSPPADRVHEFGQVLHFGRVHQHPRADGRRATRRPRQHLFAIPFPFIYE